MADTQQRLYQNPSQLGASTLPPPIQNNPSSVSFSLSAHHLPPPRSSAQQHQHQQPQHMAYGSSYGLSHGSYYRPAPLSTSQMGQGQFGEPMPSYGAYDSPTFDSRFPLSPPAHSNFRSQPRSAPPLPQQLAPRDAYRTPSPTPESAQTAAEASPPKNSHIAQRPIAPLPKSSMPSMGSTSVSGPGDVDPSNLRCTDFVAKLWFLLDRPEYSAHIRWNNSGESFIFYPTPEFASEVLARLFKHSNVASFVRQLNLYGFQRISHLELLEEPAGSPSAGTSSAPPSMQVFENVPSVPASGFAHHLFIRGKPSNLSLIRPKPSPARSRRGAGSKKRTRAQVHEDEDDDDDYSAQVSMPRTRQRGGY